MGFGWYTPFGYPDFRGRWYATPIRDLFLVCYHGRPLTPGFREWHNASCGCWPFYLLSAGWRKNRLAGLPKSSFSARPQSPFWISGLGPSISLNR